MIQWPMFVSVFSSYGDETLHKHSAANGEEVPDQVEVYVMLSGVARLIVPYGKGKVAVYRLLPHSVAVLDSNAYHDINVCHCGERRPGEHPSRHSGEP